MAITTGLVLGALFVASVSIGDKNLALWTGNSKMIPELAPTAYCRPVVSLAFAAWLFFQFIGIICGLLGTWLFIKTLIKSFMLSLIFAVFWKGYSFHPPFEGIEINVREPKVKFAKMDYRIDPENLGSSVFFQLFWYQFSAMLVNIELGIHYSMGNDQDRANEDGDNTTCEGMMAQEMNHGKCQLLYSRSAEKILGYPSGYRRFWKFLVYSAPLPLLNSFVAYLEASFIVLNGFLADFPFMYDRMWAEPRWVFAWHVMEESEHCWDSVQDLLERTDFVSRLFIWTLGWILLPILLLALPLIEGLAYGRKALNSRETLVWSFSMWLFFNPVFLFTLQAGSFLHLILGMRPSDHAYLNTFGSVYNEVFKPYSHHFKTTHSQKPSEHLVRRPSIPSVERTSITDMFKSIPQMVRMSFSRPSIRSSMQMSATPMPRGRASQIQMNSIKRLSAYRSSLYSSMQDELLDAGMDIAEIEDAGFGISQDSVLGRLSVIPSALTMHQELLDVFEEIEKEDAEEEEEEEGSDASEEDADKKNL